MDFAQLTDETKAKLAEFLPAAANIHNPVDVLGDATAERYRQTLAVVAQDPGVDALVVLLSPQSMTDPVAIAREVIAAEKVIDKPVMANFLGDMGIREAVGLLQRNRVPHYPSPERAVAALKAMSRYKEWLETPQRVIKRLPANTNKVKKIIKNYRQRGQLRITEQDAKAVFEAYGFNIPGGSVATTSEMAVATADKLGYPVVMKIVSQDVVHKSDAGGVRVGLKNAREVEDAFDLMMMRIPKRVPGARLEGVLIEEMKAGGREVIIGMTRDPQLGSLVMFGLGGIFVEVMSDVAFHIAPITADEAMQMLEATKTFKLLKGVRGQKGVDIESVALGLQRISQLVVDFPEIKELDINPLKVGYTHAETVALDARIALSDESN